MNNNKIEYTAPKVADVYVDEAARTAYRDQIVEAETYLNEPEVKEAFAYQGLTYNLQLLEYIRTTDSPAVQLMESAYQDYMDKIGFVPNEERQRIHASYMEVADELSSYCSRIAYMLRFPFDLKQVKGRFIFDPVKVDEHINTIGVSELSPLQREYIEQIGVAVKAMITLHNWEIDNGLVPYALTYPTLTNGVYVGGGIILDALEGTVNIQRIITGRGTYY